MCCVVKTRARNLTPQCVLENIVVPHPVKTVSWKGLPTDKPSYVVTHAVMFGLARCTSLEQVSLILKLLIKRFCLYNPPYFFFFFLLKCGFVGSYVRRDSGIENGAN